MSTAAALLLALAVAFAWNLGVHYTGAVMGMPHAARAVAERPALAIVAVLALLGATFASSRVESTVGHRLVAEHSLHVASAVVIVAAAGGLTALYNYRRIPTSTIQILVFTVVGVGVAAGATVEWRTLWRLAIVWAAAPLAACALGFAFTHALDLVSAREGARVLPVLLVLVGAAASFVMGANDVANATGPLVLAHRFSLREAGAIGGTAMAVGALTWGRRILRTVAFDLVHMDLAMASAAQGVQALVVVVAVAQGYFTSMNQALVGAMAGAGLARGRRTVQRAQLVAVLRGWLVGPASGFALGYAGEWIVRALGA